MTASEACFPCGTCGKTFTRSFTLRTHQRVHTGEKPFACGTCGKSFTRSFTLRRHERVHTGEKPYPCRFCPQKFSQSSHLTRHERVHTGERPYHCRYCSKSFSVSYALSRHERVHREQGELLDGECDADYLADPRLADELGHHYHLEFQQFRQQQQQLKLDQQLLQHHQHQQRDAVVPSSPVVPKTECPPSPPRPASAPSLAPVPGVGPAAAAAAGRAARPRRNRRASQRLLQGAETEHELAQHVPDIEHEPFLRALAQRHHHQQQQQQQQQQQRQQQAQQQHLQRRRASEGAIVGTRHPAHVVVAPEVPVRRASYPTLHTRHAAMVELPSHKAYGFQYHAQHAAVPVPVHQQHHPQQATLAPPLSPALSDEPISADDLSEAAACDTLTSEEVLSSFCLKEAADPLFISNSLLVVEDHRSAGAAFADTPEAFGAMMAAVSSHYRPTAAVPAPTRSAAVLPPSSCWPAAQHQPLQHQPLQHQPHFDLAQVGLMSH